MNWSLIKPLLHGQVISLLITGTGVFASILSSTSPSTNFPLLMNSLNYFLLSFYFFKRLLKNRNNQLIINDEQSESVYNDVNRDQLHNKVIDNTSFTNNDNDIIISNNIEQQQEAKQQISVWWYIFAAILDAEANFLVLLAYNYTTITSVMLLDCFTIPCAMILSYICLGCRYRYKHIIGTIVCLLGLSCIIINDSVNPNDDEQVGTNPILGDILCLCGAVLYASSNVLQEHLVKYYNREEYLGNLGCCGIIIAVIQCMSIELSDIKQANYTSEVIGSIIGFVLCLFFMYINTTIFLQDSDAILFNLSLLTSDVYAVIFTYFFYGYLVSWLYFLAFSLVIIGLIIYHIEKPPIMIGKDEGNQGLFFKINSLIILSNKENHRDNDHNDSNINNISRLIFSSLCSCCYYSDRSLLLYQNPEDYYDLRDNDDENIHSTSNNNSSNLNEIIVNHQSNDLQDIVITQC